jgi:hypothetical protein
MALLSPTAVLPFTDAVGGTYRSTDDAARLSAIQGLVSAMPAVTNDDTLGFAVRVGPGIILSETAAAPDALTYSAVAGVMNALQAELSANGAGLYSTVAGYAAYQNGLAAYTCLYSPRFALVHWIWGTGGRRTPAALLPASSVFAPATALGTATVGAAGAVTFTPGSSILTVSDTTGGVQGYAPSKGVTATAGTAVSGTEVIAVTYNGWDSTGAPFVSHVGHLDVSSLAGGATTAPTAWTPQSPGDRVSLISAMAVSGSPTATSGTLTFNSIVERAAP